MTAKLDEGPPFPPRSCQRPTPYAVPPLNLLPTCWKRVACRGHVPEWESLRIPGTSWDHWDQGRQRVKDWSVLSLSHWAIAWLRFFALAFMATRGSVDALRESWQIWLSTSKHRETQVAVELRGRRPNLQTHLRLEVQKSYHSPLSSNKNIKDSDIRYHDLQPSRTSRLKFPQDLQRTSLLPHQVQQGFRAHLAGASCLVELLGKTLGTLDRNMK